MSAAGTIFDFDLGALRRNANVILRRPYVALGLGLCIFEIIYWFAFSYSIRFRMAEASPFWVPDSILLCALLRSPKRYWWLFILAPLPIRVLAFSNIPYYRPLWYLLWSFAIDSGEGVLAAYLLRRVLHGRIRLESFRDFGWFALIAVLIVPAVAAFAGSALRYAFGHSFWATWPQWYLGNALAQVVITPAVMRLVFLEYSSVPRPSRERVLEFVALSAGLIVSSYVAFFAAGSFLRGFIGPLNSLSVPFLFWAAIRFGMSGAATTIPVFAFFCLMAAIPGEGPFAGFDQERTRLILQNFLLIRAVPVYLIAILAEQRNIADHSLRESELRFRTVANAAPVLLWMSGWDKLCSFFNQGWLEFTGRHLEAELGKGWLEGVHSDDVRRCFETYSSSFDARRPFEMEYRLRRHDGEYRWIMDVGVPRYNSDGKFCGYIGSAIDITDRRQAEENSRHYAHMQRLALVGELSAVIAHEVRQPLNAIHLHATAGRTLLRSPNPPYGEVDEILLDIEKDVRRTDEVMDRIRRFLHRQGPGRETIDLNTLISDVVRFVADEARKRNITIDSGVPSTIVRLDGDRVQLMQVLLNLLMNGMDSMEAVLTNHRRLTLQARQRDPTEIEVSIRDHGRGISGDNMPRLFEAFFTTRSQGMGMGLYIAKSIVNAHKGRIWAENNPDAGATFYFTLPISND